MNVLYSKVHAATILTVLLHPYQMAWAALDNASLMHAARPSFCSDSVVPKDGLGTNNLFFCYGSPPEVGTCDNQ